jgi:hypothetical protein
LNDSASAKLVLTNLAKLRIKRYPVHTMKTRLDPEAGSEHALPVPIVSDLQYLHAQPLPKKLLMALSSKSRVYVRGKPHQVKALGINSSGKIIGKLEPLDAPEPN